MDVGGHPSLPRRRGHGLQGRQVSWLVFSSKDDQEAEAEAEADHMVLCPSLGSVDHHQVRRRWSSLGESEEV